MPQQIRAAVDALADSVNRRLTALEKSVSLSFLKINPANYGFLYAALPVKTFAGGFYWGNV